MPLWGWGGNRPAPRGRDGSRIRRVGAHRVANTPTRRAPGESGVLALTATAVNRVLRALHQAGIPAVELSDCDGRSRDRVKVGTVKRAQGLEFTQVLMALVSSALLAVAGSDGSARIGADPRGSAGQSG